MENPNGQGAPLVISIVSHSIEIYGVTSTGQLVVWQRAERMQSGEVVPGKWVNC